MTKPAPFIDRFGLWTAEQTRQARALKARIAKNKLKLIRLVWSDTHGHARTKEVTIPAFLSALIERLQHQCRDHDARCLRRAHLRLVHARRRHGARGDDRLAQSDHRAGPVDLPGAAVGARASAG